MTRIVRYLIGRHARLLVAALLVPSVGFSQRIEQQTEAQRRQMQRAAERTIDMIRTEYRARVSPSERRVIDEVQISVTLSPDVYRVRATTLRGVRRVEISVGWLTTMEMIQDAALFQEMHHGDPSDVTEYVLYVAENVVESTKRYQKGQPPVYSKPYLSFIGEPDEAVWSAYREKDFQTSRLAMKIHTLALVLAHELAHHRFAHRSARGAAETEADSVFRIRRQEAQADDWAIELANRSGYYTLISAIPFMFYSVGEADESDVSRTHPMALCRTARALVAGIDASLTDSGFADYARRSGLLTKLQEKRGEAIDELASC